MFLSITDGRCIVDRIELSKNGSIYVSSQGGKNLRNVSYLFEVTRLYFRLVLACLDWVIIRSIFLKSDWLFIYLLNSINQLAWSIWALLTPQWFQTSLTPRIFPVWDFVVGIFTWKALLEYINILKNISNLIVYYGIW